MTIEQARRRIEDCCGFDDPTSMVGEAWDLVKREVERLELELEREAEVALAAVKSCQDGDELIDGLQSQLAASQERERILREGIMSEDNVLRHEIGRLQALNHAAAETFARQIGVLRAQLAASQERETVSMNSDNLCTPHKIFLNSQNLTGCVLCERNKEIEDLKAQLAASQERERILRDGLEKYAHTGNWAHMEMNPPHRNLWMQWGNGYDIAERTLKAADEVNG